MYRIFANLLRSITKRIARSKTIPLFLVAFLVTQGSAAPKLPLLTTFKDERVIVKYPERWSSFVDSLALGIAFFRQDEKRIGSPLVTLRGNPFQKGRTRTELYETAVDKLPKGAKILLERYVSDGRELHLLAGATEDGKERRIAVVVLADPRRDLELEGSFMGERKEFENLGGLDLLIAITSSVKNLQARTIKLPIPRNRV